MENQSARTDNVVSCDFFADLLVKHALLGEMEKSYEELVELHIENCSDCRTAFEILRSTATEKSDFRGHA